MESMLNKTSKTELVKKDLLIGTRTNYYLGNKKNSSHVNCSNICLTDKKNKTKVF